MSYLNVWYLNHIVYWHVHCERHLHDASVHAFVTTMACLHTRMSYLYVPSYLNLTPTATFSFANSSTLQVYEGDMLKVCVRGEQVSTSTEVKIIGSEVSNKGSAIGTIIASIIVLPYWATTVKRSTNYNIV